MSQQLVTVDIHFMDGGSKKISLALGTIVAYEIAFDKMFADAIDSVHCQSWLAWRQCQKIDSDTPSFEDWVSTVSRLYFTFPKRPKDLETG